MLYYFIVSIVLPFLFHETSASDSDCLNGVADAVFSSIFNNPNARRIISDININQEDINEMIEIELAKIERGEPIYVDSRIQEMVQDVVKNLPEQVLRDFESQFKDDQNLNRRNSNDCSRKLGFLGKEFIVKNQQFSNQIIGNNNNIEVSQ